MGKRQNQKKAKYKAAAAAGASGDAAAGASGDAAAGASGDATAPPSDEAQMLAVLDELWPQRPKDQIWSAGMSIKFGEADADEIVKGCLVCASPGAKKCAACKAVRYCSADCQRGDWKRHKSVCKAVKRIKEKKDPSKEPTSDWNKSGGGWWNAEREAEYYEFQEEVKQIHPRLGRAGQDVGGEEFECMKALSEVYPNVTGPPYNAARMALQNGIRETAFYYQHRMLEAMEWELHIWESQKPKEGGKYCLTMMGEMHNMLPRDNVFKEIHIATTKKCIELIEKSPMVYNAAKAAGYLASCYYYHGSVLADSAPHIETDYGAALRALNKAKGYFPVQDGSTTDTAASAVAYKIWAKAAQLERLKLEGGGGGGREGEGGGEDGGRLQMLLRGMLKEALDTGTGHDMHHQQALFFNGKLTGCTGLLQALSFNGGKAPAGQPLSRDALLSKAAQFARAGLAGLGSAVGRRSGTARELQMRTLMLKNILEVTIPQFGETGSIVIVPAPGQMPVVTLN
ncbi:hypothetical protein TeGR_g13886 [Tetraparma gracilis]|uniref:MYND-type domain-containing protein n=1 Tax=Tetraparma gracilis TaxID=2962635 RepID=A0ABQ6N8V2_9STRA|nr:hypothetical protein TeGR_g13886 [Tetraparma gracilis]